MSDPEAPLTDGCEWPLAEGCCDDLEGFELAADVTAAAVALLRGMRPQYGLCETTVWPCATECPQSGPWYPTRVDGSWSNLSVCGCPNACGCGRVDAIILDGPVHSIIEIVEDGVTIWPTDPEEDPPVRVFDRRMVVRIDGEAWPRCQHLGGEGWQVTYLKGAPVPASGQLAAAVLACELAKQCKGESCRLPWNFTSVSRQGVTFTKSSMDVLMAAGLTGVPEVDLFLMSTGPANRQIRVLTPDIARPKEQTWPV